VYNFNRESLVLKFKYLGPWQIIAAFSSGLLCSGVELGLHSIVVYSKMKVGYIRCVNIK